jgi:hypothetical protein
MQKRELLPEAAPPRRLGRPCRLVDSLSGPSFNWPVILVNREGYPIDESLRRQTREKLS